MKSVSLNIHHADVGVCFLPDGEDSAEIIHDVVELDLQVFEDVAGLHTQLTHAHGNTQTELTVTH